VDERPWWNPALSVAARDVPSRRSEEYGMGEVPLPPGRVLWRKSSMSGDGNCLEAAVGHEHVWIRDSKNPSGLILGCTQAGWTAFLGGVQGGEFAPCAGSV
jgi:hypothetical protein